MTLINRKATDAYLEALNNAPRGSRPNVLANMADRMAGAAFDGMDYGGFNAPSPDDMMNIETSLFVALCEKNAVNWRFLEFAEAS